jgi:hypothetical protein
VSAHSRNLVGLRRALAQDLIIPNLKHPAELVNFSPLVGRPQPPRDILLLFRGDVGKHRLQHYSRCTLLLLRPMPSRCYELCLLLMINLSAASHRPCNQLLLSLRFSFQGA